MNGDIFLTFMILFLTKIASEEKNTPCQTFIHIDSSRFIDDGDPIDL